MIFVDIITGTSSSDSNNTNLQMTYPKSTLAECKCHTKVIGTNKGLHHVGKVGSVYIPFWLWSEIK